MSIGSTIKSGKIGKKFKCELCDYTCLCNSDLQKHFITRKHQIATGVTSIISKKSAHICTVCNKEYNTRSGLWRHKQKCFTHEDKNMTNIIISEPTPQDKIDVTQKLVELIMTKNQEFMTEVITKLTNSNQEVMEKMMERMPNVGNITTNSHNTTNNNQFNIQMFLNNHCKNAMNLTDFIDSLPITAETYDSNIDNGLTKTIANMFTTGLSQLDILERPIHCTDAARKTLYVKEGDVWEKDNELTKMIQGIRHMAAKQRILINKWKDAYDDWNVNDRMQDRFTTLVCNMVEDIENQEKETNKIIRSVGRQVYLNSEVKNKYLE
jgi:hypothetical protein